MNNDELMSHALCLHERKSVELWLVVTGPAVSLPVSVIFILFFVVMKHHLLLY